jgi:hypothetical protein
MVPGRDFGEVATDHVRISYANSRANLARALERMAAFVGAEGAGTSRGGSPGRGWRADLQLPSGR